MNLMKLLTVGQSLKEGKTILGKYKLTQESLLPKFTPPARTIKPVAASAPIMAEKKPIEETQENIPAPPSARLEPVESEPSPITLSVPVLEPDLIENEVSLEETQKIPVGTVLKRMEEQPVLSKSKIPAGVKDKFSGLWKKWSRARSRKKAGVFAVQTEWALEKVTVVRNDLSEADLEIVARKTSATKPKTKRTFAEVSQHKHHGHQWIKRTASLFKRRSPFEKSDGELRTEAAGSPQAAAKS